MSLDEEIAAFLARTEAKPTASKLEPYVELIRSLRQRRWTYVQIALVLHQEFKLQAHPTTIHAFVKVRERRKSQGQEQSSDSTRISKPAATAPAKRPRFNLDA